MAEDPIPVLNAFRNEYSVLRPEVDFSPGEKGDLAELFQKAHRQAEPFSALCISGGGIRSATFALGAIQALAEHGLLAQFDYLSTVSGGGYIGGWLTAWVQRAKGIDRVIPRLRRDAPAPLPDEADPIQHLREYNNYLTPKLGALSPDSWTLGSTILRNIFLNWLVLIPILLFALMIPRFLLSIDRLGELYQELHGSADVVTSSFAVSYGLPLAAAILFAMSMINTLRYLPAVGNKDHTAADFVRFALSPLVLSALAFTAYDCLYFLGDNNTPTDLFDVTLWMLVPSFAAWLLYLVFCRKTLAQRWTLLAGPLSIAIALMGIGTGISAWYLTNYLLTLTSWAVYVTIALPLLLFGFGLAGALFVGLSSSALEDEDREWLSRAAAYLLLVCALWVAACAVVLIFPGWAFTWNKWGKGVITTAAGLSAWISSVIGHRGDNAKSGQSPSPSPNVFMQLAAKAAPPLFVMFLAMGLAALTNALLAATGPLDKTWWDHNYLLEHTEWGENIAWAAGFLALGWLMARYININKFSLEGMYRERLIRAYLGASNSKRTANRFIGFCKNDNLQMHEIDTAHRPFHVVNMTLNLVGGDRLAWQQRKAESLTASPLHCGNARLGYRDSAEYGGKGGISLGTAITISGAAASPNMGYHSSALMGFIMTLFNLRLGSWLGNPGKAGRKSWKHASPRSAIKSLVREAFGLTNDDSEYVNLSDGGHFENLGIYEMVHRRCRTIVVLDGGQDEGFGYEDLGNALRKIRIDLKIPIVFREDVDAPPPVGKMKRCATATIQYSAMDGEGTDGELIYIKPMILGNEPPDVTSYHSAFPAFPHQSTSEQWFDESQTESYRMLGQHTVDEIVGDWDCKARLQGLHRHVETKYFGMDGDSGVKKAVTAGV